MEYVVMCKQGITVYLTILHRLVVRPQGGEEGVGRKGWEGEGGEEGVGRLGHEE